MKKQFTLSVSNPCSEQWDTFLPNRHGAFCSTCQKNVVDFTQMSEQEIIHFFNEKPQHICGRMRSDQLKSYHPVLSKQLSPGWNLLKAGLLGLSLMFASQYASAKIPPDGDKIEISSETTTIKSNPVQEQQTLMGIVRDENNEPLPGVSIYIENTYSGTVSDVNGQFQLTERFKEGDVVIFSYLGYNPVHYTIQGSIPNYLEIALKDYHIMVGEVQMEGPYEHKGSLAGQLWKKVKQVF